MENIALVTFLTSLLQYESFHMVFSKRKGMKTRLRHFIRGRIPKVDAVRDALAWMDPEELRRVHDSVLDQIYRNKVLRRGTVDGYCVAAIDGVELIHSKKKSCKECLKRTQQNGEMEYFHRSIVCATVGSDPHLILGEEMLHPRDGAEKDEGELTGGKRLMEKLYKRHGHFADVIVGDALYLNAPFLNMVLNCRMEAVIRLKDEKRRIYQDAEGLFGKGEGRKTDLRTKEERVEIWDLSGFEMEHVEKKLRVIKVIEYGTGSEGKERSRMYLVTTAEGMKAETLWRIMHKRWDIEENAFHQLKTYYHADHCYVHQGEEVMLELMMLAFNMRELYLYRRLRNYRRNGYSRKEATEEWRDWLLLMDVTELMYEAGG